MLKIGITGGFGSGKTVVAGCFAELGVPVVDADEVVHSFLKHGNKVYRKIVAHFGIEILDEKKNIDRKKLHGLIFAEKKERIWLENLIHPYVCKEMNGFMRKIKSPYGILVVPLLFETKFPPKVDRVLVIDCPKAAQIERGRKRNNYTIAQIKRILDAQTNRKDRLKRADDVICNTGSMKELRKIVEKFHNYYLSLA